MKTGHAAAIFSQDDIHCIHGTDNYCLFIPPPPPNPPPFGPNHHSCNTEPVTFCKVFIHLPAALVPCSCESTGADAGSGHRRSHLSHRSPGPPLPEAVRWPSGWAHCPALWPVFWKLRSVHTRVEAWVNPFEFRCSCCLFWLSCFASRFVEATYLFLVELCRFPVLYLFLVELYCFPGWAMLFSWLSCVVFLVELCCFPGWAMLFSWLSCVVFLVELCCFPVHSLFLVELCCFSVHGLDRKTT